MGVRGWNTPRAFRSANARQWATSHPVHLVFSTMLHMTTMSTHKDSRHAKTISSKQIHIINTEYYILNNTRCTSIVQTTKLHRGSPSPSKPHTWRHVTSHHHTDKPPPPWYPGKYTPHLHHRNMHVSRFPDTGWPRFTHKTGSRRC